MTHSYEPIAQSTLVSFLIKNSDQDRSQDRQEWARYVFSPPSTSRGLPERGRPPRPPLYERTHSNADLYYICYSPARPDSPVVPGCHRVRTETACEFPSYSQATAYLINSLRHSRVEWLCIDVEDTHILEVLG